MGAPASSDPSEWVDRYGDYLFRYAMLRLRDRSASEDLVQETFLAALKSRGAFSGGSSEATWLVGILKHKIADHFRHQAREAPLEDGDLREQPDPYPFDGSGHWTSGPTDGAATRRTCTGRKNSSISSRNASPDYPRTMPTPSPSARSRGRTPVRSVRF